MATIVFSAIGTLIGGPIGGAVGALIGRQVDSVIIGSGRQEGPRLKELATTASSYGAALPRHFGRMRVPGSVIWATDLVEHQDTQGGGKNRPKVTTYNYTASFAVALSSRPIAGIGRIWADGNLLRGAAGDLKAGGQFRIYTGGHDQLVDPLMSQAEGETRCPAYRGLAYVVFEDLELGDFFNRIPALTFEVIADEAPFTVANLLRGVIDDVDAAMDLAGVQGFSCEGPLADTLQSLDPVLPMDCDAAGETLVISRERLQAAPVALSEAAASVDDSDFGQVAGFARRRSPPAPSPFDLLRYYDIDRDYQPGVQRAGGRPAPGQPRTIELPAALSAADAHALAVRASRRTEWNRDRMAWRTSELDPAVSPGAIVTLPEVTGRWKVMEWEWRERGVELSLSRVVPTSANAVAATPVDGGRPALPLDVPAPPSSLVAFELPWDGLGSGDTPATFAAVSSSGATWAGAALFVDHGTGELVPLGPSGRTRSIVGRTLGALPSGNPLMVDRTSSIIVELVDEGMTLADATLRQLFQGANRALIGAEVIQFGSAEPVAPRNWRIANLLRGRGGTESGVTGHGSDEPFVLLDNRPIALDPALIGTAPGIEIIALGRGDSSPASSPIALAGATLRPLPPVHARHDWLDDGSLKLRWIRRARGAWFWLDGVDVPLNEQAEVYRVGFGPVGAPLANWSVTTNSLILPAATLATLAGLDPAGTFWVRQQGNHALSEALQLASIA